ncbi:MAG: hypothetical protein JRC90_12030 [Deltaproteobacteria bacterium]|nr:hypothetical protein [Deltaproteobacteria bacterium]
MWNPLPLFLLQKQNKSRASKILGISRNELYRKIGKYQIRCKS